MIDLLLKEICGEVVNDRSLGISPGRKEQRLGIEGHARADSTSARCGPG